MNPQIEKALQEGFNSEQIINYLLKKFPKFRNKIQSVLTAGFSTDQVLKYLTGGRKELANDRPLTEHQKTRAKDIQQREDINRRFGQGAALAGTALAAPYISELAAPMAEAAIQRAIPSNLSNLVSSAQQLPIPGKQPIQSTVPQQPPNVSAGNIPQAPEIPQAKKSITDIVNEYKGLDNIINNLKDSGNGPEEIAAYFKKFQAKQTNIIEKETGRSIKEIIKEYLGQQPIEQPKEAVNAPSELQVSEQPGKEILPEPPKPAEEEKPAEAKPIAKNDIIASSQGIGEVLEIRNGQALIDVDGKKHVVPEEELLESPLPEKDLADLYEDLVKGIEKETGKQVSRNVNWAGYDPNTNELAYKPHGSNKLYIYDDISEEDKDLLTSLLTQRKTTGENFIGAWGEGTESPIGAAMYQLIRKLQSERGGKGQEYKNRFESIYDALEPAILAAKKKYVERKKKAKKPRPD